ncbi:MAG: 16S rRNA (cytidine(1402)-2'-O)-methyltransferase [Fermentimonas sp.]|jgi:16S rRNA (cytidine1402-2'-O)-methyltransferase
MGKLFVVPTPIGNLEDITFRAIRVLKECGCILAEDTRTSLVLMKHYGITTHMESHHKFNEHSKIHNIVERLKSGEEIALISDAGTPAISDPGYLLVRECVNNGIEVECLPGATAFVPAIVQSGIPSDRFCFEGFLPTKKGRHTRLLQLADEKRTMIFYESTYRVKKTLIQFAEVFGEDRRASVSREISKIYAETTTMTLGELVEYYQEIQPKGEFVIVVEGDKKKEETNKKN